MKWEIAKPVQRSALHFVHEMNDVALEVVMNEKKKKKTHSEYKHYDGVEQ